MIAIQITTSRRSTEYSSFQDDQTEILVQTYTHKGKGQLRSGRGLAPPSPSYGESSNGLGGSRGCCGCSGSGLSSSRSVGSCSSTRMVVGMRGVARSMETSPSSPRRFSCSCGGIAGGGGKGCCGGRGGDLYNFWRFVTRIVTVSSFIGGGGEGGLGGTSCTWAALASAAICESRSSILCFSVDSRTCSCRSVASSRRRNSSSDCLSLAHSASTALSLCDNDSETCPCSPNELWSVAIHLEHLPSSLRPEPSSTCLYLLSRRRPTFQVGALVRVSLPRA